MTVDPREASLMADTSALESEAAAGRAEGDGGLAEVAYAGIEVPVAGELVSLATTGPASAVAGEKIDLRRRDLYLNRELTWLAFNFRVMNEARDRRVPLLERVKFLAIVSANMDEFFMKRIGGLKQQIGAGVHTLTVDGRTPVQQLEACRSVMARFRDERREVYLDLLNDLRKANIRIRSFARLDHDEQGAIRTYYHENIFPLVTPLAMDPAHPFPFISNLSLNILVTLRFPGNRQLTMARIKVPVGADVPRFLRVG